MQYLMREFPASKSEWLLTQPNTGALFMLVRTGRGEQSTKLLLITMPFGSFCFELKS